MAHVLAVLLAGMKKKSDKNNLLKKEGFLWAQSLRKDTIPHGREVKAVGARGSGSYGNSSQEAEKNFLCLFYFLLQIQSKKPVLLMVLPAPRVGLQPSAKFF